MKKIMFGLILLFLILPVVSADSPVCISPAENCQKINNFIESAIQNQDLSYCKKIYEDNITAYIRYSGFGNPPEGSYADSSSIELHYCWGSVIDKSNSKQMCDNIGIIYKLSEGVKEVYGELGTKNIINSYKVICYRELAENTNNPETCKFMRDLKEKHWCYKSANSPTQYFYWFLIFLSEVLLFLGLSLTFRAPFLFPVFLVTTIILFVFFIKSIKNKKKASSIILGLLLLIFISLDIFEAWTLLFNWPPSM